jgi:hypothetical protein
MSLVLNGTDGLSDVDGSAATPAIRGTDANTGIYFPGADRIGFAEGGVQVGEFDASGNFQMNSGYGSAAIAYGCRAWVNFNGTGTVAIRASGNVSSITDNGTGDYTVNFTTAMPDANYAVAANTQTAATNLVFSNININRSIATTSVPIVTVNQPGSPAVVDPTVVNVAVFR